MSLKQEDLKSRVTYDSESGVFTYITKKDFGRVAGHINQRGYLKIGILNKSYFAHRLAWLYIHGELSDKEIDHINQNKLDNRIVNLREVDSRVNMKNLPKYKSNKSGQCGVGWKKANNKWYARIDVDGKRISLGYHIEYSDAVNARKNAEVLYGFHKNHGGTI